jgi:hypothetical protein
MWEGIVLHFVCLNHYGRKQMEQFFKEVDLSDRILSGRG